MQGLVVSVHYDDLLRLTLPFNAPHFDRIILVTSPTDEMTTKVGREFANVEVVQTDAFYANGAVFNKGAAVEEATKRLDPEQWTVIFDADIVMPRSMPPENLCTENLYSPWRINVKTLEEFRRITDANPFDLTGRARVPDAAFAGYFQLFHPCAAALRARPWYGVKWRHAGNCDTDFSAKFGPANCHRLNFDVIHLGPAGNNWFGRATPRWCDEPGAKERISPRVADFLQTQMYINRRRNRGLPGPDEQLPQA